MAWNPPVHLKLEEAFFEVIPKIPQHDWTRFAILALRLKGIDVNDCEENHLKNAGKQKIAMLNKWQTSVGEYATVENLFATLNHYLFPETCCRPEYWDRINQPSHNYVVASRRNAQAPPTSDAPYVTQPSSQTLRISESASAPGVSEKATGGAENETGSHAQLCENISEMILVDTPSDMITALKNDSGNYTMTHHLRGYVLIFNNEFKGLGNWERTGSLKDVENLQNLWEKLGCKVVTRPDLGGDEMVKEMETFIKSDKRQPCDYVCFFIMSHGGNDGNEEYFSGSDRKPVMISRVLDMLDNDFATKLQGIPKLLFLQFCRGTRLDTGVMADGARVVADGARVMADGAQDQNLSETFRTISSIHQTNREDETTSDSSTSRLLPKRSDILISYATQFDYKALRDTQQGTWFINAIAKIFCIHSAKEHVADMMTMVNNAVSEKTSIVADKRCKEMSEYRSLLKKKLYLLPGYKEDETKF